MCLPVDERQTEATDNEKGYGTDDTTQTMCQAGGVHSAEPESSSDSSGGDEDSSCEWSMERINKDMEECTVPHNCSNTLLQMIFADAPPHQPDDDDSKNYNQEPDSEW